VRNNKITKDRQKDITT